MAVKEEKRQPEIVVARKCDVPMAEKKHFLPCEGGSKCRNCVACMEQTQNGEWRHCAPREKSTEATW